MRSGLTYLIFFVTIAVVLCYSLAIGLSSIFVLWLVGFVAGISLYRCFKGGDRNIILLFVLCYCVYTLFMLITNYALVRNPAIDYFYTIDSTKFWKISGGVENLGDLPKRFSENAAYSAAQFKLFNLICLVISYFAELIDKNNIVVQKLQSVFFAAMSIPLVYLTIRKFCSNEFSFKASLFFSLFTFVATFSAVYGRDIHIYFIYTYAMFLVVHYESGVQNLVILLGLCIAAYFIRFENGVFLVCFLFGFLYLRSRRKAGLQMFAIFMLPLLIYLFNSYLQVALNTYEHYSTIQAISGAEIGNSLAGKFSNYPFGLKQLLLAGIGQTYPLPFYRVLSPPSTVADAWHAAAFTNFRFSESISGTVWIFIWGIIVYALIKTKFPIKLIPTELLVIFAVASLYILVTTADLQVRRTFCVYPAVFSFAMYLYFRLSRKQRRTAHLYSFSFLICLYGFYYIIK